MLKDGRGRVVGYPNDKDKTILFACSGGTISVCKDDAEFYRFYSWEIQRDKNIHYVPMVVVIEQGVTTDDEYNYKFA